MVMYIAFYRPDGFVYSDGNYTTLDYPGSQATIANGINDQGEIVGYAYVNGYSGSSYIDGVEARSSVPDHQYIRFRRKLSRSDRWNLRSSGQEFGFLYVDGTYTTLSFSESLNTSAVAINDLGADFGVGKPDSSSSFHSRTLDLGDDEIWLLGARLCGILAKRTDAAASNGLQRSAQSQRTICGLASAAWANDQVRSFFAERS